MANTSFSSSPCLPRASALHALPKHDIVAFPDATNLASDTETFLSKVASEQPIDIHTIAAFVVPIAAQSLIDFANAQAFLHF